MDKENNIAERFRTIRRELDLTQDQLAKRLLISRNYVAKIEAGLQEPAVRLVRDLEALRVDSVNKASTSTIEEGRQQKYGERSPPSAPLQGQAPMRINPGFEPPQAHPTRAMVEEYIRRYLDAAEKIPGGIPHAMIELRKHLRIQDLDELQE